MMQGRKLKTAPEAAPPALPDPEIDPSTEIDTAPVPPDPSGWQPHPSERRDFFSRIRAFPPDVASWRRRLLELVRAQPGRFPAASGLEGDPLSAVVDTGISFLREVARILAELYGTPDLGNKADPTDEL